MIIVVAIFFSLTFIGEVLAIPLNYNFSADKLKGKLQIPSLEIVPSKVIEKIVSSKNAHGKTITRKQTVPAMDTSKKGKKEAYRYFLTIRKEISSIIELPKKTKTLKGDCLIKLQIQKDGRYDLLYIGGKNSKLQKLIEQSLAKVKVLSQIPDSLEIEELQIKFTLIVF